jgi:aminoglycoside phosphotransferase family enzyme
MRRLDTDEMLDRRIARGDWHYAELEALAHRLAGFFATARRVRLSFPELLERMYVELRTTVNAFDIVGEPRLLATAERIAKQLEVFLRCRSALFRQRSLVDGHGDLRPEHVI